MDVILWCCDQDAQKCHCQQKHIVRVHLYASWEPIHFKNITSELKNMGAITMELMDKVLRGVREFPTAYIE